MPLLTDFIRSSIRLVYRKNDPVFDALRSHGVMIVHGADFPTLHDQPDRDIHPRVREHFELAQEWKADKKPALAEAIDSAISEINGYAFKNKALIVLPDQNTLLEKLADHGIDTHGMRRDGATQEGFYQLIRDHEIAHFYGTNAGYTQNEFHAQALGYARYLDKKNLAPDHIDAKLWKAFLTVQSLLTCLQSGTDEAGYGQSVDALEWVASNWHKRDQIWDLKKQNFLPEVLALMNDIDPMSRKASALPLELAQHALDRHLDHLDAASPVHEFIDALDAAQHWLEDGAATHVAHAPGSEAEDMARECLGAAKILRQLRFGLYDLRRYTQSNPAPDAGRTGQPAILSSTP